MKNSHNDHRFIFFLLIVRSCVFPSAHLLQFPWRWRRFLTGRFLSAHQWSSSIGCWFAASARPSPTPAGRCRPAERPSSPQTPCEEKKTSSSSSCCCKASLSESTGLRPPLSLLFLLQQSLGLVQSSLNLLHAFVCVFGRAVEFLLQQTETDVRLAQLLPLRTHKHHYCRLILHLSSTLIDFSVPCVFITLIFRDFFSSLMTVSLSSSFMPRPSASVISARRAAARTSTGGGFWEMIKERNMRKIKSCTKHFQSCIFTTSYLALRLVWVVLSLLHGGGHLVHGCDDDAAGLSQTLVGVGALRSIDLKTTEIRLFLLVKSLVHKAVSLPRLLLKL